MNDKIDLKKCSTCKIFKNRDDFHNNKSLKDGKNYTCKKCMKIHHKSYYIKNRQEFLDYNKKHYRENKEYYSKYGSIWQKEHKEEYRDYRKKWNQKTKKNIMSHYSNNNIKCICCDELNMEFLTLDHIKGGGTKHRQEIKRSGSAFYSWLIRNNYPSGYRVLCFNCNCAIGMFGKCPHNNLKNPYIQSGEN